MARHKALAAWALLYVIGFMSVACHVHGESHLKHGQWFIHHDFGCHEIESSKWTRKVCFGDLSTVDSSLDPEFEDVGRSVTPRLGLIRLGLSIQKSARGRVGFTNACGDSIRGRFVSEEGIVWFATIHSIELTCGAYEFVFEPPPHPGTYSLEFRLIHIDGEGRRDPMPELGWHDNVLGGQTDADYRGPPLYNILRLALGKLQVMEMGVDRARLKEGISCTALLSPPPLPMCTRGDHRGRWTQVDDPFYPPFEGEPIHWLPHGCRYPVQTTTSLRSCLGRHGQRRITFFGESIMQHTFLLLMTMLEGKYMSNHNGGRFYWPPFHKKEEQFSLGVEQPYQLKHYHGLGLVVPALREAAEVWQRDPRLKPSVLVFLCAHNDMMRRSMAEYERNLRELVSILQYEVHFAGHVVWITSPTRVYKSAGGQPGECRCPGGRSYDCGRASSDPHCVCMCGMLTYWMEEDVVTGDSRDLSQEEVQRGYPWFPSGAARPTWAAPNRRMGSRISWEGMEQSEVVMAGASGRMPLVHNTYERIAWANARAVDIMKDAFPGRIHIVDFAALTDALTPDYCFDGLHWSCEEDHMHERSQFPWHCKNLANAAATNILANVLCGIP